VGCGFAECRTFAPRFTRARDSPGKRSGASRRRVLRRRRRLGGVLRRRLAAGCKGMMADPRPKSGSCCGYNAANHPAERRAGWPQMCELLAGEDGHLQHEWVAEDTGAKDRRPARHPNFERCLLVLTCGRRTTFRFAPQNGACKQRYREFRQRPSLLSFFFWRWAAIQFAVVVAVAGGSLLRPLNLRPM